MKELTLERHLARSKDDAVRKSRMLWSILLLFTMVGSSVCMFVGLSISLLSWLDVITVSATIAYLTVGLLLGSFSLIFLAAHCMDRVTSADKAERRERSQRSSVK